MLKKEVSIPTGLAVAAVVFAIHQNATPALAEIQALPAGIKDVDSAERKATWASAGVVAGISLLAKDPTIFVIGSAAVVGMAWFTRHANWTESLGGLFTGAAEVLPGGTETTGPELAETAPVTMFSDASNEFVR